jgi:hypothetical protein
MLKKSTRFFGLRHKKHIFVENRDLKCYNNGKYCKNIFGKLFVMDH